jgi:hypothetical protein
VDIEGARTGLALDASSSMAKLYGVKTGPSPIAMLNLVEPAAQAMASFLTRFSRDGRESLLYWTCLPSGAIEGIGHLDQNEAESHPFGGPKKHDLGRPYRTLRVHRATPGRSPR